MKTCILFLLLEMSATTLFGQKSYDHSYVCKQGEIHFYASTPVEDVDAISHNAVCVINTQSKKVSAKVQMNTFEFKRKLMQQDYNENFVESEKYPYATLDAVITDKIDFTKDGTYKINLKGSFDLHGVKTEREIPGTLVIKNGQPAEATAEFMVKLEDHNIKIPTAVILKVAKVVKVNVHFTFEKYLKS